MCSGPVDGQSGMAAGGGGQATEPPYLGGSASETASYLHPRRVIRINIVNDLDLYQ